MYYWRKIRDDCIVNPKLPEARLMDTWLFDNRAISSKKNILTAQALRPTYLKKKEKIKKPDLVSKGDALLRILNGKSKKFSKTM